MEPLYIYPPRHPFFVFIHPPTNLQCIQPSIFSSPIHITIHLFVSSFFSIQPTIQLSFSIHPTIPLFLSNHLTSIFVFPSNHPIFLFIMPYMFFYPSNHPSLKKIISIQPSIFYPRPNIFFLSIHSSFLSMQPSMCFISIHPTIHLFFYIHPVSINFFYLSIHPFFTSIQPSIHPCSIQPTIHLFFCSVHPAIPLSYPSTPTPILKLLLFLFFLIHPPIHIIIIL